MEMAKIANDQGYLCLAAFVAPKASVREKAAELIGEDRFIVVHCAASLESCQSSDPSGLYAEAKAGNLDNIPGISFEYEEPENPALRIDTDATSTDEAVAQIIAILKDRGLLL